MTNAKKKTVFTVNTSLSLARNWRNAKRGASKFAEEFPEAFKKISNAAKRRNGIGGSDVDVANWLINNA